MFEGIREYSSDERHINYFSYGRKGESRQDLMSLVGRISKIQGHR